MILPQEERCLNLALIILKYLSTCDRLAEMSVPSMKCHNTAFFLPTTGGGGGGGGGVNGCFKLF